MFYLAEALLLSRGLAYSSHSAVIAAYGKEFARSKELSPKFHRNLIAAQDTRQIGDYGVEKSVSDQDAEQIIVWAEEFYQATEEYLRKKTALCTIVTALVHHARDLPNQRLLPTPEVLIYIYGKIHPRVRAWPSGKASAFQADIRGFESHRPLSTARNGGFFYNPLT
jgi:hypothetical protein